MTVGNDPEIPFYLSKPAHSTQSSHTMCVCRQLRQPIERYQCCSHSSVTYTDTKTRTHAHTHARTHARMHARTHANSTTYTHTYTNKAMRMHTSILTSISTLYLSHYKEKWRTCLEARSWHSRPTRPWSQDSHTTLPTHWSITHACSHWDKFQPVWECDWISSALKDNVFEQTD